tara:strand:- start:4040 stop:4279 length:240 start_codon:yes stop_codon:yes gene_type:complete
MLLGICSSDVTNKAFEWLRLIIQSEVSSAFDFVSLDFLPKKTQQEKRLARLLSFFGLTILEISDLFTTGFTPEMNITFA